MVQSVTQCRYIITVKLKNITKTKTYYQYQVKWHATHICIKHTRVETSCTTIRTHYVFITISSWEKPIITILELLKINYLLWHLHAFCIIKQSNQDALLQRTSNAAYVKTYSHLLRRRVLKKGNNSYQKSHWGSYMAPQN